MRRAFTEAVAWLEAGIALEHRDDDLRARLMAALCLVQGEEQLVSKEFAEASLSFQDGVALNHLDHERT
eukprot:COSAG06_NODE_29505_length_555_cov_0.910088_1_plen_68_part_10